MMRVSTVLTLLFLNMLAFAQNDEKAVKATIIRMFDGMRKSDSTMIKTAFTSDAIMQTIVKTKDGKTMVRSEQVQNFVTAVTKPHDKVYDERIKFDVVKVDGDLAIAWTPYKFYIGDQFSHCGVNSFQLVKVNGEWKIQYIIDTRRKEKCK